MKKKLIFTLVLLVVLVISANAQYSSEGDFTVTRNSDNTSVTITGYVGTSQTVNIPPTYRGLSVTVIGEGAFRNKGLTSVIIPNSVTSIGPLAFVQNQLTSITIPNSVTSIGNGAFDGNPNLTVINVSSSNINYSSIEGVLYNKNRTTLIRWPAGKQGAVVIPNSVTSIRAGAFFQNRLTSITIPSSVTSIGDTAFAQNQLTSITIPSSVTSIGDIAFYQNQLTSVIIGSGVTSIGANAFTYNQLTSITIPNSVTTIGDFAFSSNQLTSVTIGSGVTSIGVRAFLNNQLTSITIPNSVTTIGDYAFSGNPIRSVTIGSNVDIGSNFPNGFAAFYNSIEKKAGTYDFNGSTWAEW